MKLKIFLLENTTMGEVMRNRLEIQAQIESLEIDLNCTTKQQDLPDGYDIYLIHSSLIMNLWITALLVALKKAVIQTENCVQKELQPAQFSVSSLPLLRRRNPRAKIAVRYTIRAKPDNYELLAAANEWCRAVYPDELTFGFFREFKSQLPREVCAA